MRKIDRETTQRILDAAEIVDVVSDYVTLKRRGANYIGLCPFHNERTPSFSVSKSKGICKCFSCGKGGSPVNFIMEIEQMTYQEALRHLANKYNIQIVDHEETPEERKAESQRQAFLAVNQFAAAHFAKNLTDTTEGQDIALPYFRHRGINDDMIKQFGLGYAIDRSDDLMQAAVRAGFEQQTLIDTGLVVHTEDNRNYDRFRGRVIFPIYSISGRILGFGGRTMRTDKKLAKYVNSPESIIYNKSNELYGFYQAKTAIDHADKCYLVEGYMDVISMHQIGIKNVVASSGTSLTRGQIRLLHRFTKNVTVIYDADAAGIKASIRGIDLLLDEGLNIKILQLPVGEDPDSFAQSHSTEEVERYIGEHEVDFIQFKTNILLADSKNDTAARSAAITDIVNSIALINDDIARTLYLQQTSRNLDIDERVITREVARLRRARLRQIQEQAQNPNSEHQSPQGSTLLQDIEKRRQQLPESASAASAAGPVKSKLYPYEREIVKYVARYGLLDICFVAPGSETDHGQTIALIDFVRHELELDQIQFTEPLFAQMMDVVQQYSAYVSQDLMGDIDQQIEAQIQQHRLQGEDTIRKTANSLSEIQQLETQLDMEQQSMRAQLKEKYLTTLLHRHLTSLSDDTLRNLATDLITEPHQLSNIYTKTSHIYTEAERLYELVPRAIHELKYHILCDAIAQVRVQIGDLTTHLVAHPDDVEAEQQLTMQMKRLVEMTNIKLTFAKHLGDRIITP